MMMLRKHDDVTGAERVSDNMCYQRVDEEVFLESLDETAEG
jgi:hypothetical protein